METILHILGICPDSFSHVDILDIIVTNYNQIQLSIYKLLEIGNMYK